MGALWAIPRMRGEVDPGSRNLGRFVLAVTTVLSGMVFIAASSKLWFQHLWPRNTKSYYYRRRHRRHGSRSESDRDEKFSA